jgi:hypothetical protein
VIPTACALAHTAVHVFYTNKHEIKLSGSTLQKTVANAAVFIWHGTLTAKNQLASNLNYAKNGI